MKRHLEKVIEFTRHNESRDPEAACQMFSPDLVVYANVFDKPLDHAGEIAFINDLQSRCDSVAMDIESLTVADNGIIRKMRAHGTMKDGEPFNTSSTVRFVFDDNDLICEMHEEIDLGELGRGHVGTSE